jgi:hypothetical protein
MFTTENGTSWKYYGVIGDQMDSFRYMGEFKGKHFGIADGVGSISWALESPDGFQWKKISSVPIYHGSGFLIPALKSDGEFENKRFQIWGTSSVAEEDLLIYESDDFLNWNLKTTILPLGGPWVKLNQTIFGPTTIYWKGLYLVFGHIFTAAWAHSAIVVYWSYDGLDWRIEIVFDDPLYDSAHIGSLKSKDKIYILNAPDSANLDLLEYIPFVRCELKGHFNSPLKFIAGRPVNFKDRNFYSAFEINSGGGFSLNTLGYAYSKDIFLDLLS